MTGPALDVASYGVFIAADEGPAALSRLRVEFLAIDVITEWTRCSNIADFVAQYLAADFADRSNAALVLSTVLNELVENGAKFSSRPEDAVTVTALHFGDTLRLDVTNTTDAERARTFAAWLDELHSNDAHALFLKRLTDEPAASGRGSGIGLLILIKDYGARIAARIAPADRAGEYLVDVQVSMSPEEIEQQ